MNYRIGQMVKVKENLLVGGKYGNQIVGGQQRFAGKNLRVKEIIGNSYTLVDTETETKAYPFTDEMLDKVFCKYCGTKDDTVELPQVVEYNHDEEIYPYISGTDLVIDIDTDKSTYIKLYPIEFCPKCGEWLGGK